ncbi:hypothetical protein ABIQ69_11580 [Agromyces sp. G08B096]|uniref:Peptidase S74 domain-containing protein n=1 Tax=Agromyces sp. G08B096 TaxID=3156399 RepID=A0AAU7W466_9MICO
MALFPTPPAEDDLVRQQRDLVRDQEQIAAARELESSSIGEGGLTVQDGGAIRIEDGGDLFVDGDATFNGNLTVPAGSLNTAGSISASGNVQGGGLISTGSASVAGTLSAGGISTGNLSASGTVSGNYGGDFPAGLRSTGAYNTLVTGGGAYVAAWIHSDGRVGYAPSSRRFKTGFVPVVLTIEKVLELQGFYFQYLAAVPYDQAQQRWVIGLLAEDTHNAGFPFLVDYDEDGEPFGIRADLLAVVVLEGLRDLYRQHLELKATVVALAARLEAAGI